MSVILLENFGTILDHDEAVRKAYKMCLLSSIHLSDAVQSVSCTSNNFAYPFDKAYSCDVGSMKYEMKFDEDMKASASFLHEHTNNTSMSTLCVDSKNGNNYLFSAALAQSASDPFQTSAKGNMNCLPLQCNKCASAENSCIHENCKFSDLSKDELSIHSLKMKHGFFAVLLPFMMDSQFRVLDEYIRINADGISMADVQTMLSTKCYKVCDLLPFFLLFCF